MVVLVAILSAAWLIIRPTLERRFQSTQDYSIESIGAKAPDAMEANLETKTHWTLDDVKKMQFTNSTFVSGQQAHYIGYILAAHDDIAKALEAYKVAADTLPESQLTADFYVEYGQLADRAGNTALKAQLKAKAVAAVDATNDSVEEKETQHMLIERQLGDE